MENISYDIDALRAKADRARREGSHTAARMYDDLATALECFLTAAAERLAAK